MATLTIPETSESVVPVVVYENGRARDIRLHPVAIDPGPGPTAFFPRPAAPATRHGRTSNALPGAGEARFMHSSQQRPLAGQFGAQDGKRRATPRPFG